MTLDPRLRVLYLLAVAIGVFFLRAPWQLGALAGAQALSWLAVRLPPARLLRQVGKLWGFALFIVASYALTADDPATDRWVPVALGPLHASLNVAGALTGALMVLRIVIVVLASQVARAGDERAIAAGLGKLGTPKIVAASIDAVLALMGSGPGSGSGRGGGRGRGGGKNGDDAPGDGFWASLKKLGKGDVEPILRRIERQIERSEEHLQQGGHDLGPKGKQIAADVAVIAGISLTMLGIKALKILPSIPFAPGHKLVILTPLYIVASVKTKSRLGATLTGLTMGTVAFLLGDGRYGIFEILKHVAPGLVCDLVVPVLTRGGRLPGTVVWSLVGGLIGAARFTTIFLVTLTVQAPAVAYAVLVPGMTIHTVFGILSGVVSYQILRPLKEFRPAGSHQNVTSGEGSLGG